MSTSPGWYYAEGDPVGTQRYWDGIQWQGGPQPSMGYSSPGFSAVGGGRDADRSPLEWYKLALSRWSKFDGRARRAEYWWFTLINAIVALVLYGLAFAAAVATDGEFGAISIALILVVGLYGLAMIVPGLAVGIRRLHDTDKSGWWLLIGVIPIVNYIGGIVLLIFYFTDGTRGPNQFGQSPKY